MYLVVIDNLLFYARIQKVQFVQSLAMRAFKESMMTSTNCQSVAEKRDAFVAATYGLPEEVVTRVMRGLFLPTGGEHDAQARSLLQAWAQYRPHFQLVG